MWLLSVPWWVPWGFALIPTLVLIWVSWPRESIILRRGKEAKLVVSGETGGAEASNIDLQFSDGPPHKWGNDRFGYTGLTVVNKSGRPALNVQVAIIEMEPRPINGAFHTQLPIYLRPINEQKANNYTINPYDEKCFVLSKSWISGPPNNPVININDPMEDNSRDYIVMRSNERWRLRITASSSNAGSVTRDFTIGIEQARVNVRALG